MMAVACDTASLHRGLSALAPSWRGAMPRPGPCRARSGSLVGLAIVGLRLRRSGRQAGIARRAR